jgi:RNA recognition motif-containing protein
VEEEKTWKMSNRASAVFVGNISFDATEQQLIELFSSVGTVVSMR